MAGWGGGVGRATAAVELVESVSLASVARPLWVSCTDIVSVLNTVELQMSSDYDGKLGVCISSPF